MGMSVFKQDLSTRELKNPTAEVEDEDDYD